MGQSLSKNYIHLTFGTKARRPYIDSEVEEKLYAYIGGILRNKSCSAISINSMPDHIHILFLLSKNEALAKVVEDIKKESSKWMKLQGVKGFTWQIGYGAFSVSSYKLEVVKKYIQNQKIHHKVQSYKEEVEEFMEAYNVENYESEYYWR